MARLTGFEPAAYRVGVCCSIQLGYKRIFDSVCATKRLR